MTWLIVFLLNHAPTYSVNKWACDLVNSQQTYDGCYDWCIAHALWTDDPKPSRYDSTLSTLYAHAHKAWVFLCPLYALYTSPDLSRSFINIVYLLNFKHIFIFEGVRQKMKLAKKLRRSSHKLVRICRSEMPLNNV